jgi:hypothetical protein
MNRDDMRMVERGDSPSLALEAVVAFGIECRRVWQHFDRDRPVESYFLRAACQLSSTRRGEAPVARDSMRFAITNVPSGMTS